MDCCEVYLGEFGDCGWERVSDDGGVLDESGEVFERYEDCVEDARRHGYSVTQEPRPGELLLAA